MSSWSALFAIRLLLFASLTWTPALWASQTLALLPLKGDAEVHTNQEVNAVLRAEIGRLDIFSVQPIEKTQAEMETAISMGISCETEDAECMTKLGLFLQADRVVEGELTRHGPDVSRLLLRVRDVDSGRPFNQVEKTIPGPGPDRLLRIREVVELLLSPERRLGSLLLKVQPPGAEILVDGILIGTSPLNNPLQGLSTGVHRLEIRREGFVSFQAQVGVQPASESRLDISLVPQGKGERKRGDSSPFGSTASLAAIAGGAVFVGGGVGVLLMEGLWLTPLANDKMRQQLFFGEVALVGVALTGALIALGGGVTYAVSRWE